MDNKRDEERIKYKYLAYLIISLDRNRLDFLKKEQATRERELFSESIYADVGEYQYIESQTEVFENSELFNSCSEQERSIILLKAIYGYTFDEISRKLNLSVSNTKYKYYKAIQKIKNNYNGVE